VLVVAADGTIVHANPAAAERLGGAPVGGELASIVPERGIHSRTPLDGGREAVVLRERGDVLRQQAAIAELGQRALAGMDLRELMQETSRVLADVLAIDMVEVLELLPDHEQFAMRGHVGGASSTSCRWAGTHSRLCLTTRAPVIVSDTATEDRFSTVGFLREQHVVEDARRDGATAFVEKPFSGEELLRAVRAVLDER